MGIGNFELGNRTILVMIIVRSPRVLFLGVTA
jgi:hypothetical protein